MLNVFKKIIAIGIEYITIFLISIVTFRMNLNVKIQQNTIDNPWNVEKIEEFLYFCCPECDLKDHSQLEFLQHALERHPNSKDFIEHFNKNIVKEETYETNDDNETYIDYNSLDNYYVSNEILKCEIKEEEQSDTELEDVIKNQSENVNEMKERKQKKKIKEDKNIENKTYDCYYCNETFQSAKDRWNHNQRLVPDIKNRP